MGKIEFSVENKKATSNYDYPKLKLKQSESARILLLEMAPEYHYVHTLRAPKIVQGKAVMETAKRKNGGEYQTHVLDFLSNPICLGDESILDDKGSDPKNCPMCSLAKENPDFTDPARRRYAMHVIRYRTKSNGTTLVTPFSVETLVWSFTDRIFNKIVEMKEEWDDLRKHDLILGPCENENFQKFDISVGAKAAWLENAENKSLTLATFKENQIPDLAIACGSRKEKKWIEEDIATIRSRWAEANGEALEDVDLDEGLNGLDDEGWSKESPDDEPVKAAPKAKTTPKAAPKTAPVVDEDDDLLGDLGDLDTDPETPEEAAADDDDLGDLGLDDEPEEAPVAKKAPAKKPAAKPAPKAAEVEEDSDAADLADLLGDIDDL